MISVVATVVTGLITSGTDNAHKQNNQADLYVTVTADLPKN